MGNNYSRLLNNEFDFMEAIPETDYELTVKSGVVDEAMMSIEGIEAWLGHSDEDFTDSEQGA